MVHSKPKDALPPHSIGGMVRTQATMARADILPPEAAARPIEDAPVQ
jgi:hypothetical protein